jgi:hypothetical protein
MMSSSSDQHPQDSAARSEKGALGDQGSEVKRLSGSPEQDILEETTPVLSSKSHSYDNRDLRKGETVPCSYVPLILHEL